MKSIKMSTIFIWEQQRRKIVYMKHDTSFFVHSFSPHFSLILDSIFFSFFEAKSFRIWQNKMMVKFFVSRTWIYYTAHSWRTNLLNGSLVHREQLQKECNANRVKKGQKLHLARHDTRDTANMST